MAEPKTYTGGCHCGAVKYQAELDLSKTIACNCSICAKQGLWLAFADMSKFKLLSGEETLRDYQFNKKQIHHRFCTVCGVESFANGEAPDGTKMYAVNVRCLDDVDISHLTPSPFDGKSI